MIIMKFGGSSLESAHAIRRVTGIVRSQLEEQPLVVVSAIGKTTDQLLEAAGQADRGHSYVAWKAVNAIAEHHSEIANQVSRGQSLAWLEESLRKHFNCLRRLIVGIEEGTPLTPALQDEILSYGERLSSEVFTAALESAGVPSLHLDSRQLILTGDQFTHATPLYWQSYARLRRVIPNASRGRTIVMGGFIGATESGVTTTLGRGGSDLTASIVGAGVGAEEIQIWTDVSGMLTADPKLFEAPYRLKTISYREAATMAQAGAKVLHPETIRPAVRQRIPIVIRNSRRPEVEGTTITPAGGSCWNACKSIAVKQNLTVLEMRFQGDSGNAIEEVKQLCGQQEVSPAWIGMSGSAVFIAIHDTDRYDRLQLKLKRCVEVRLHKAQAVVTLVGLTASPSQIAARALEVLKNPNAFAVSDPHSSIALAMVVSQSDVRHTVKALHREFFAQIDPSMFAEIEKAEAAQPVAPPAVEASKLRETHGNRLRVAILAVCAESYNM